MSGDETSSMHVWGRAMPLTALRAFEATGRHGSLRKAADELGVTPSAISHRIKYLERYLGRPLIDRRKRTIAPTSIGQILMTDLTEGFSRLNGAMRWIMETRSNSVKISTAPTVAVRWVIPRLGRFRTLHPEIDVQISISGELVDFLNDDIDIAIRYGMGRYPRLMSDKLFGSEAIVVCTQSLLKKEKLPLTPANLIDYALLEDADTANAEGHPGWQQWFADIGVNHGVSSRFQFNCTHLAIEAALSGHGIALVDRLMVLDELKKGHLICPIDHSLPMKTGYYLVYRQSALRLPAVSAFRRWVLEEARSARFRGRRLPYPSTPKIFPAVRIL